MSSKSFTEQRQYLQNKLDDLSLFEGGEWNFLKVVQHGLIYCNNNNQHKLIRHYLNLPPLLVRLVYWLKSRMNRGQRLNFHFKKILIFESGRSYTDPKGQKHSVYFKEAIDTLGKENISVVLLNEKSDIPGDFKLSELKSRVGQPKIDASAMNMLHAIQSVIHRLKMSKKFTGEEVVYVSSSFHLFFEEYLLFHEILKTQKVKTCLFYPHYHREGMVAAGKVHGIKMVEFQHGLIAENDLYYAYDLPLETLARRAFFSDKLLLMGPYWRDVVLRGKEHNLDTTVVVGDYSAPKKEEIGNLEKENLIFIGAQKNMAPEYVAYTEKLLEILEEKHPDWKIELKMHPLEKRKDLYREIRHRNFKLIGNEGSLTDIIRRSKIQISIYSTTLFDALGYQVVNFSLQNYSSYSDYAVDMLKEGVSLPLKPNEDPVEIYKSQDHLWEKLMSRDDVYSSFSKALLREAILN